MSIKPLIEPESVAVVGASRNPAKLGAIVLRNLINLGFNGRIYPVNPNANEIMGLKAYPSVKSIPDNVDLAVIVVPAPQVLDVVRDCVEKKVKGIVIISSGFKDIGDKGAVIEEQIVELARKAGIRIFGPNTTGLLNTSKKLATTFVPLFELRKGNVSIIAQTGLFAGAMLEWLATSQKFGVSKVIGLGNKCDVDDAEALEYLGIDPETHVILMDVEGVKDGRRFI
ncbi:MAG: CoA-binding protein, partial [Candidatus Methanomethylicia archaeon]